MRWTGQEQEQEHNPGRQPLADLEKAGISCPEACWCCPGITRAPRHTSPGASAPALDQLFLNPSTNLWRLAAPRPRAQGPWRAARAPAARATRALAPPRRPGPAPATRATPPGGTRRCSLHGAGLLQAPAARATTAAHSVWAQQGGQGRSPAHLRHERGLFVRQPGHRVLRRAQRRPQPAVVLSQRRCGARQRVRLGLRRGVDHGAGGTDTARCVRLSWVRAGRGGRIAGPGGFSSCRAPAS